MYASNQKIIFSLFLYSLRKIFVAFSIHSLYYTVYLKNFLTSHLMLLTYSFSINIITYPFPKLFSNLLKYNNCFLSHFRLTKTNFSVVYFQFTSIHKLFQFTLYNTFFRLFSLHVAIAMESRFFLFILLFLLFKTFLII